MPKIKAKFNTEKILNGKASYGEEFESMVVKYTDKVIEVEEEVFGGYELELEGKTWALNDDELIILS